MDRLGACVVMVATSLLSGIAAQGQSGTTQAVVVVMPNRAALQATDLRGRIGVSASTKFGYGNHYIDVIAAGAPLLANLHAAVARVKDPYAQQQLKSAHLQPYRGEAVTHVSVNVSKFCDPPGVRGTGEGSGGRYQTCGVAIEDWSQASRGGGPVVAPDLKIVSITTGDAALTQLLVRLNSK